MTIKRIFLPLAGSATYAAEIDLAMSVAKAMAAHIEALYIHEPPFQRRSVDGGMYYTHGSVAEAAQAQLNDDRAPRALEVREQFVSACAASDIPMLEATRESGALPSASWQETQGSYVDIATERAAAFDLVIAASAAVAQSLKTIAEHSLMDTRRPVLLAPSRLDTRLTDAAMIAWDESPECWHAVSAAVPLLKLAQSVHVVSVDKNATRRHASQAEALAYLRCHGISGTEHVISPEPESHSVGDALLATAAQHDSGLLVMGAYSHSPLREMFFGGVTRHVLQSASTRPVFLAH